MATAYVSYHRVALREPHASSVYGRALYSEALTISGTTATTTTGQTTGQGADVVARVKVDADCYVAWGDTPDPTATAVSAATSARVALLAGDAIDFGLTAGAKVAVKALS
ncbi:hypothetical protein [Xanthobacter sp. VNH20]|uniref:hypothetical protein n=1 Tax=Xanthobacter sp. VNH20 TaxID=3156616 RepID=UPI0032B5D8FF